MASVDNVVFNKVDKDPILTQDEAEHIYISKICKVVGLDENDNTMRSIAKNLLINGRRGLEQYRCTIAPVIFEQQINKDCNSELLQILKEYFEQQWQHIPCDWFQKFLDEQKINDDSKEEYQRVLTRAAEHGCKFIGECPIFSIVLQLVFEFDDEAIVDDVIFDTLWKSFRMNGFKLALEQSAEHLVPEVMEQQMSSPTSPLFLALREYFRKPVMSLLQQCKIPADRRNLLEIALDCLANDGWTSGLSNAKVEKIIQPRRYKELMTSLRQYLDEQDLVQHTYCIPQTSTKELHRPESTINQTSTDGATNKEGPSDMFYDVPTSFVPPILSIQNNDEFNESYKTDPDDFTIFLDEIERSLSYHPVRRQGKIHLSTFMQAAEFMYIQKSLDNIAFEIVDNFKKSQNFPEFIEESMLPIIYLLKRQQNLNDFFDSLSSHYSKITDFSNGFTLKLNMRMLIHALLLRLDLTVSRIAMNLLCKQNPVPFLQPSLDEHPYAFVPDIIHVWDYSTPILLSFGIGPCQGKSSLLNTLFKSLFEQTTQTLHFQRTIDIDFGYNFLPRRSVNIADTHGLITKQLLCELQNLFDGFIIHIESRFYRNNTASVQDILKDLPQDKFSIIIIRDINENLHSQYPEFLQIEKQSYSRNIPIVSLPNVSDRENNRNRIQIRTLQDRIFKGTPQQSISDRKYLQDELQRLIGCDAKAHLNEIDDIIEPLKNELIRAVNNVNDMWKCFPIYTKFEHLCSQREKIINLNFRDSTNEDIYTLRQNIYILENEIKDAGATKTGQIFDLFINILRSNETMAVIDTLITILRYERNQFMLKYPEIDQKNLSLEVLWRNVIVCYPYQQNDVKQMILDKYVEYMLAGYPFEIIDGDNYHFPFNFLRDALSRFQDKKILVVSIIGPQNSGKSTLLNYMFGTLFDVRDGRCTRGIYGTFVTSNFSNCDYVLLIDTEGLMGVERDKNEFDRRLVLFCLAVSHVVIINIMRDIDNPLKDMLTLCADTLKQIGVTKVPQPNILFVLNQRLDLDTGNSQIAIGKIIADMKNLGLDETIGISKENFYTLPFAFKRDRAVIDARSHAISRTEVEFIEHVHDLCGKVIESGVQPLARAQEYFRDPVQWLNFSNSIFDTLQKFSDLTYFRDVNERKQDHNAREFIKKKLAQIFTSRYKLQLIEETVDYTEMEIRDKLNIHEVRISNNMERELENELKMLSASDTIRGRSRQFLKAQITAMFTGIRSSAVMAAERKKIRQLVQDGEGELKRLIEETIATGMLANEEDASLKFQLMFDNMAVSIKNRFIPYDCLNQTFNFIYTNYNIYEHDYLPDCQVLISEYFEWLIRLNKNPMSLSGAESHIQTRCTLSAYQQHGHVEKLSFDPDTSDPYSLDIIENLVYLNKDIIRRRFNDYCDNQVTAIEQSYNQHNYKHASSQISRYLDRFRRAIPLMGRKAGSNKSRIEPTVETYSFLKQIRELIENQKLSVTSTNSIVDNDIPLRMSSVFQRLTDDVMQEIRHGQIDTIRIQKIVGNLHSLIQSINSELDSFKLALSRHVKAVIHSCAVLLLTKSYYNEQQQHFEQTLTKLNDSQQGMRTYFVSMVVPNVSYDTCAATNLIKQLKDRIYQDFKTEAQGTINTEIWKIGHVNRRWVQERCDGKLHHAEKSWLHNYVENPNKIIEDYFVEMWKSTRDQINRSLNDQKLRHIEILKDFFRCITWMFNAIKDKGAAVTFVDSTFQSDTKDNRSVNENCKNKKRCMAMIFYSYLSGEKICETLTVYEATYKLKSERYSIFHMLAKNTPPTASLSVITRAMRSVYDNISIGNLAAFLETLLKEQNQLMNFFNDVTTNFDVIDKENTYNRLLDKVRGCLEKCPCCCRPCDVDHTLVQSAPGSKDNQHSCDLGHALRAMNGYRYEVTGEASLTMCEFIKPDQVIVVGPTRKRWSKFMTDHADWKFDPVMNVDKLNQVHGKSLNVWSKIGPDLCTKYGMKFVTTNTLRSVEQFSFHYILLLDGSGSMKGQPWKDLLDGVKEFLKHQSSNDSNNRISIIVFSSDAKTIYRNEMISNVDLSTIGFAGNSTNFNNAFEAVHKVITYTEEQKVNNTSTTINNSQLNYTIIFMSDGQATYPEKELNGLTIDYGMVIKHFWTVALGKTQMDSLEKINEKMKGCFLSITDSSELLETYAEIARTMNTLSQVQS